MDDNVKDRNERMEAVKSRNPNICDIPSMKRGTRDHYAEIRDAQIFEGFTGEGIVAVLYEVVSHDMSGQHPQGRTIPVSYCWRPTLRIARENHSDFNEYPIKEFEAKEGRYERPGFELLGIRYSNDLRMTMEDAELGEKDLVITKRDLDGLIEDETVRYKISYNPVLKGIPEE